MKLHCNMFADELVMQGARASTCLEYSTANKDQVSCWYEIKFILSYLTCLAKDGSNFMVAVLFKMLRRLQHNMVMIIHPHYVIMYNRLSFLSSFLATW